MNACLTLYRSYCEGLVKACICERSPSGIDHHGWHCVAIHVHFPKCIGDGGGFTVYMT